MEMGSKGVFLMIWGKREYGYAAANFAMSIKFYSPSLPVHLLTDQEAIKGVINTGFFDSVEYMDETPRDPALAKMQVYDKLPFHHNLFLDVDALCIGDLSKVIDNFINDGKPYRCAVHTWYDQSSPEDFPLMVWATKSTIWNHYNLNGEKLPATQSSIQFIQKGDFCKSLFEKIQGNYANKIPLEKLKNKWGGGQPDELYLNITLAQLHYDPSFTGVIYFGDDLSKSFTKIKIDHQILSMFGTAQNIKKPFLDAYDASLKNIGNHLGGKPTLWKYIAGGKHANVRSSPNMSPVKRGAFTKRFFKEERLIPNPIKGSVYLFTSYYDTKHDERQIEIDTCFLKNIENDNITKIYNLGKAYKHPKVINIDYERPTFQDFIDQANKANGDYSIIANSDIHFDETLKWIGQIDLSNNVIALSRYDIENNGRRKLNANAYSQDVWIFGGKIKVTNCNYQLGLIHCDNKFAYDCIISGYKIHNPAKDIITYHIHNSNYHTYSHENKVIGNYRPVFISSIKDLFPKTLLIKQPGKVGDIIRVLPIAKWYSERGYDVFWKCPSMYHHLFKYTDYVTPVENNGNYDKTIDISFGIDPSAPVEKEWRRRRINIDSWMRFKYEIAHVPLDQCTNLQYTRNIEKENALFDIVTNGKPYKLVHQDYGVDLGVEGNVVYFSPVELYSIFDWRKVVENASEIHCIVSSLINYVDCLDIDVPKYHYITQRVAPNFDRIITKPEWIVINQVDKVTS